MDTHQDKLWTKSFITLTVGYLLLFLSMQMLLSPFPTYVKEQFHPGNFALSLVTSMFALSSIATRFATAALLKYIHRNTLLFFGLILAAVTTFLYPFATSMTQLLILRVIFGVGFGMTSTVLPTLVSQTIPHNRMGEGIGYFGLSTSIAMSVGPTVGLAVIKDYGFMNLSILGTVTAFAIIPLLLFTRSIPQPPAGSSASSGRRVPGSAKHMIGRIIVPALLTVLMSVTYGGLLGFIALYGQEKHFDHIGLFFLFIACTILIIRPISGKLFDRKGPALVIIPGALVTIASMLLLSYADSMVMVILAAMLYGLGYGTIQPTAQAWMLQEVSPDQHSTANSLYYNAIDFGVAGGSMLLGVIASATSFAVMYRYSAGVMVIFLVLFFVQQRMGRRTIKANAKAIGS